jgi:hypothetical protein
MHAAAFALDVDRDERPTRLSCALAYRELALAGYTLCEMETAAAGTTATSGHWIGRPRSG